MTVMKRLALAALLLLPLPTAAQDALTVDCKKGTVALENWFAPEAAPGQPGEKVLPMHMLLRQPGTFEFEFRSEQPFALYAYRYDPKQRNWEFLPSSNVAQPVSDPAGTPYFKWQTTVKKTGGKAEDYLFQAMPEASAQNQRQRFVHIRRTTKCPD